MKNGKFGEVLKHIKFHGGILVRGFSRMLYGTLVAGLFVISGMGFFLVTIDSGYTAVFDFIAACATLTVALGCTYLLGCKRCAKRGDCK